jgi:hypothetical protein
LWFCQHHLNPWWCSSLFYFANSKPISDKHNTSSSNLWQLPNTTETPKTGFSLTQENKQVRYASWHQTSLWVQDTTSMILSYTFNRYLEGISCIWIGFSKCYLEFHFE